MLRGVVLALVAFEVAPFTARRLTPSAALSRTALAIPAPAKDAFALYADLPQQPKWSPQFRSVRWIDQARRESQWTLNVPIPVSFIAKDTVYDPSAKAITWQTTARSPLRASGAVRFTESDDAHACTMALSVELQAPPLLERALSTAGLNPISDASLAEDARRFRDELVRQLALRRRSGGDGRGGAPAAADDAADRPASALRAALDAFASAKTADAATAARAAVEAEAAALARSQPASARPLDSAARRGGVAGEWRLAYASEPASSSDFGGPLGDAAARFSAAALPPPPPFLPPLLAKLAGVRVGNVTQTVSAADGGGADDEALRSESAVDVRFGGVGVRVGSAARWREARVARDGRAAWVSVDELTLESDALPLGRVTLPVLLPEALRPEAYRETTFVDDEVWVTRDGDGGLAVSVRAEGS